MKTFAKWCVLPWLFASVTITAGILHGGDSLPSEVRSYSVDAKLLEMANAIGSREKQIAFLADSIQSKAFLKEDDEASRARHASAIRLLGYLQPTSSASIEALVLQVGWFDRENKDYPAMGALLNVGDAVVPPLLKLVVERGNRRIEAGELAADATVPNAVQVIARIKGKDYQKYLDGLKGKVPQPVFDNLLRYAVR